MGAALYNLATDALPLKNLRCSGLVGKKYSGSACPANDKKLLKNSYQMNG